MIRKYPTYTYHRFLDESGDMTFFNKSNKCILDTEGVSSIFMIGMVHIKTDLETVRADIKELTKQVIEDQYFAEIPSIQKRINNGGFYFHAKDDIPEVRKVMYDYLRKELKFSLEVIVARKIERIFKKQHMQNEAMFYADILGHLLKSKLGQSGKIVLNVADRDKTTSNANLQKALESAEERYRNNPRRTSPLQKTVVFNVQKPTDEPLLSVVDYALWAVHRVFSRGETRYYNVLQDKIPSVVDIYDSTKYDSFKNYYGRNNPLTEKNKISP